MNSKLMMLELRNLIAAREANTASGNREMASGSGWLIDHGRVDRELALQIDILHKELRDMFDDVNKILSKHGESQ